jgi:hypothetical protein
MAQGWQDGSFDSAVGTNVGSNNTQDLFLGYGTEFNNPDRYILDISPIIHLLGADQTKLISWMQGTGTMGTSQISFTHMENELMTIRDFSGKLTRTADGTDFVWLLELDKPQDWQAIETAPLGDGDWTDIQRPHIYMTVNDGTNNFSVVIRKQALNGASMRTLLAHDGNTTNSPGQKLGAIVIASGTAAAPEIGGSDAMLTSLQQEVSAVPATVGSGAFVGTEWATASVDVNVNVVTPDEHLMGMPQGSGLPNESRKKTRSLTNFVQIFKTPWTVTNTVKATTMRGGDELGILRLRKTIQHKTSIEYALMFQGGGVEGTDYGILNVSTTENPLTRFKGLGVGIQQSFPALSGSALAAKAGWIYTKNADLNSDYTLSKAITSSVAIHELLARVFDDLVDDPSETKIMLCSNEWLTVLANLAATHSAGFAFGDNTVVGALGIPNVRTLTSPVGTLRLIPFKHLRGRFKDYAVVLDMKNIKYRPLRPTKMLSNVSTDDIDGQQDYMITEAGIQVMHESTHAILKLVV